MESSVTVEAIAWHPRGAWRPSPVGELPSVRVWALEGALHHAKCVKSGSENTKTPDHRDRDADSVRAQQNQKLSHDLAEGRARLD